ncbi:MAG: ParB/RepB/Spo0J family partition protein [bacterium]|nr:ParB/RepB/Spo0J family partition protein [bacterium]
MPKPVRRLGRGLESLVTDLRSERALSISPEPPLSTPIYGDAGQAPATADAPIDSISPNPYQPRGSVDVADLGSLAESLRTSGMIQPISVRRAGRKLEIIAGERRWRAAKLAGMTSVPVLIRQADDRQMLEMALIENIQREDLNAIDRARGYREYCDRFGLAAADAAKRLGEDRTTVTNYLRLLDLPPDVQDVVAAGRLSMGHARCIVGVPEDDARRRLAKSVVSEDLSVRALEDRVRLNRAGDGTKKPDAANRSSKSAHLRDLEGQLALAVGTKVTIHEGRGKGTGRLVIEYYSLDDFDRITARLGLSAGSD